MPGSYRPIGCMAVGLALAVALAPRWARAAETTLRLRWTAPAECPPEAEVHAAALRGVDPSSSEGALDADAIVDKRADGDVAKPWRLRLTTRRANRTGEREIEASTCAGVADAAAVLLGLALGRSEAPEAPPIASERGTPERDAPTPLPARSTAIAVGASGALDTATLPTLAVGGALSAAWTPGRARLELEGRMLASQSATLRASTAGADLGVVTLGGRGCVAVVRGGAVEVSPCAGLDVHWLSAAGYGAQRNFDASARWTAMTAGLLLRAPLATWLALRSRAELVVPLARPELVVQNEGSVHRPSAASGLLTAGLEANFP